MSRYYRILPGIVQPVWGDDHACLANITWENAAQFCEFNLEWPVRQRESFVISTGTAPDRIWTTGDSAPGQVHAVAQPATGLWVRLLGGTHA